MKVVQTTLIRQAMSKTYQVTARQSENQARTNYQVMMMRVWQTMTIVKLLTLTQREERRVNKNNFSMLFHNLH